MTVHSGHTFTLWVPRWVVQDEATAEIHRIIDPDDLPIGVAVEDVTVEVDDVDWRIAITHCRHGSPAWMHRRRQRHWRRPSPITRGWP